MSVMAILLRLLTILALAVMPLGMSSVQAAPVTHAMAGGTGHCDGPRQSDRQAPPHQSDCAVSCAAITPAPMAIVTPTPLAAGVDTLTPATGLRGIILEIVPPPPKLT